MKQSRTTEFVLGLLGGIFGFITGFFSLVLSALVPLGSSVIWIFILAIAGIVGSVMVKSKAKLGGWIMLISGVGILICSSLFGLLPAVLLIIAGLISVIKKNNNLTTKDEKTIEKKKPLFTRWWFWVLAIIGLFIVIAILTPTSEESKTKTTKEESKTYSVGEDVTVGDVRWKLISAEDKGDTLKGSESKYPEFEKDKKANGKYVKIDMEVENLGKDMKSVTDVKIKDDQNREFTRASDISSWIPENKEVFILSNLNPNVSQEFIDYYVVPADAKNFKVVVGDLALFSNKKAEINLGF